MSKKLLKVLSKALLPGANHEKDGGENKPESSLVLSLSKAFNKMPSSLCDRLLVGPSSLLM